MIPRSQFQRAATGSRRLSVSRCAESLPLRILICGVSDLPYHWYAESATLCSNHIRNRRLSIKPIHTYFNYKYLCECKAETKNFYNHVDPRKKFGNPITLTCPFKHSLFIMKLIFKVVPSRTILFSRNITVFRTVFNLEKSSMQWSCSKNLRKTFSFGKRRKSNQINIAEVGYILLVINFMPLGSNPDIRVFIQISGFEAIHFGFETRHLRVRIETSQGSNPDISGFESRHLSKIQNRRHKQRNCRHTLARQKINIKNKYKNLFKKNHMPRFFCLLFTYISFVWPLLCVAPEKL